MMTARFAAVFGAMSAAVAVAAGAFGAHALRDVVSDPRLVAWESAARYQVIHALAILMAARWVARQVPGALAATWLFVAGTVLFAGSLYLLVLLDQPWIGAVTPFGGAAFIAGWLAMAFAAFKHE
jgi:uncharacterized membrane protein YgdD (TMEM256/DUF423 family)